jgi:hypothetical protein
LTEPGYETPGGKYLLSISDHSHSTENIALDYKQFKVSLLEINPHPATDHTLAFRLAPCLAAFLLKSFILILLVYQMMHEILSQIGIYTHDG